MRRIPELDALRGLAALAIVVYHLWVPQVTLLGTAVDLFFVLSGYLITSIILGQVDQPGFLGRFYARRALRIWPIYYLSLLALVALSPLLPGPSRLDGLPYYLTYTQRIPDYWFGDVPPFLHRVPAHLDPRDRGAVLPGLAAPDRPAGPEVGRPPGAWGSPRPPSSPGWRGSPPGSS